MSEIRARLIWVTPEADRMVAQLVAAQHGLAIEPCARCRGVGTQVLESAYECCADEVVACRRCGGSGLDDRSASANVRLALGLHDERPFLFAAAAVSLEGNPDVLGELSLGISVAGLLGMRLGPGQLLAEGTLCDWRRLVGGAGRADRGARDVILRLLKERAPNCFRGLDLLPARPAGADAGGGRVYCVGCLSVDQATSYPAGTSACTVCGRSDLMDEAALAAHRARLDHEVMVQLSGSTSREGGRG